ncbi:MAG: glycosyltransferase family 117 protein [Candidatus Aminicenantales bacterium]
MTKLTLRTEKRIFLALVLMTTAGLYWATMLPGIGYSGDAAKFQYAGKILGVPHAPGYPLYVLLSRIFIIVPLHSVAFRVNLMSAFFALLTLAILYLALLELGASSWLAAGTTLSFAFNQTFWTQSVVAEVYTLNSFFLALIFFFLLRWGRTGRKKYFYGAIFVLGLSLSHHATLLLMAPAVFLFGLLIQPRVWLGGKTWLVTAVSCLAGLLPYSYLVLRSFQKARYVEAPVRSASDLVKVITARRFQSEMFAFDWASLWRERLPWFFSQIEKEWPWPLLLVMLIGGLRLLRNHRPVAMFLLVFILFQGLFVVNYDVPDVVVFFIPLYFGLAVFLAVGWQYLISRLAMAGMKLRAHFGRGLAIALGAAACFGSVVFLLAANFSRANMKGVVLYDERLSALFEAVSPREPIIILTDNYHESQFVNYKLWVEYGGHFGFHFELDPAEAFLPQIKRKINRIMRENRQLQCFLFPDCARGETPASLVNIFWSERMRPQREAFLSSVYFISPSLRKWLAASGVKTVKRIGLAPKNKKPYFFYMAFLPSDF